MSTIASKRQGLKARFAAFFEFILSKLISNHGKRIIFITSLYFHVVRLERLRADALTKINSIMNLAANEKALYLPIAIREIVWNHTSIDDELSAELLDQEISAEKAHSLSQRVVELSPEWVRYNKRDMLSDVFDLISKGSQLAQAA